MAERRIDPYDGKEYNYNEMLDFYKDDFKKAAIKAYWNQCKLVVKSVGKTKAKAKAKAKAGSKKTKMSHAELMKAAESNALLAGGSKTFVQMMTEGQTGSYEVLLTKAADSPVTGPRYQMYIQFDGGLVLELSPQVRLPSPTEMASLDKGERQLFRPQVKFMDERQWKYMLEAEEKKRKKDILQGAIDTASGHDLAELLVELHGSQVNALWRAMDLNSEAVHGVFEIAPDIPSKKKLLETNHLCSCGAATPLISAAAKGTKDIVEALVDEAQKIGDTEFLLDMFCAEATDVDMSGHGRDRPIKGGHAYKFAKTAEVKELIFECAQEAGGEDFARELVDGRPDRLEAAIEAAEKRKKERLERLEEARHKANNLSPKTPAMEVVEVLLANSRNPEAPKDQQQALLKALRKKLYHAMPAFGQKFGRDIFIKPLIATCSSGLQDTVLVRAAGLMRSLEWCKALVEGATEFEGKELVKEMFMTATLYRGEDVKADAFIWPGITARLREVREYLLEVAENVGGKALRDQCAAPEPCFLSSLPDAEAEKLLPNTLRVTGAGDAQFNGDYRLKRDKSGHVDYGKDYKPVWKKVGNNTECYIGRASPISFYMTASPRTAKAYQRDGAGPMGKFDLGHTGKRPSPTVEKA